MASSRRANQSAGSVVAVTDDLPTITAAQLTTLLRYAPDALLVVDAQGGITHLNAQVTALFGYPPEDLAGQPVELLLPDALRAAHRQHRDAYQRTPHARAMGQQHQLHGRRRDGSEFPVDVSLRPVCYHRAVHVMASVRDVTHQHRLERELAQRAEQIEQYLHLIDLAHDAIIVRDPISRILLWNQGAVDLYGYAPRDALGRIAHTLLHTHFPMPLRELEARLAQDGHWEGELIQRTTAGYSVTVASRQALVRAADGTTQAILEINRDVTAQRRSEQAQAQMHDATAAQRELLQHILDGIPASVTVLRGAEARLLMANRAATDLWGAAWPNDQPLATFMATNGIHLLDEQSCPLPLVDLSALRALGGETIVHRQELLVTADGRRLPILVDALPLPTARGATGDEPLALVIHQDVQVLKEAEALKDEFIGIAAHELRTPLTILKGAVSTLLTQTARGRGPALADWQHETLADMEPAIERLTHLTDDLLDVTRLQGGQVRLQVTPCDLVGLTERVVARLRHEQPGRAIQMQTSADALECSVDPARFDQVLTNIVGNALKYSPADSVVQIQINADKARQHVVIQVQDAGMGIPRQQQAQMFGRFMRANNARASGIPGTGLGLYLCRMLVELHGGRIWFTSAEGHGTTFCIELPRAPAA